MSPLLRKLSAPPTPHPYSELFRKFSIPNVAAHLDVSPSHLHSVLSGRHHPSKKLDAAMSSLAAQIRAEVDTWQK